MNIWQSPEWNEMLIKTKQVEKIIQIENLYIQKRQVSFGEYGLFCMGVEINKIPEKELENLCKEENALFIQIETLDYTEEQKINISSKIFQEGYYKKFITPYTALVDLSQTEEEILALMKPKGRYNIKLAKKKEIQVEIVKKNQKNIKDFFILMQETTTRDKFSGHPISYYENFLASLPDSKLLLAYKNSEVIAGGIFTFSNETSIYYYGASSSKKEFRNLMAPYLLQWTAITHAKSIGSILYDFLGISGEGQYYDETLKGVTDFKLKLTKNTKNVSESFIFINKKIKFQIIKSIKQLKIIRK